METIEVRCPFCAGRYRVAAQHTGKSARCRKCGERFELRPYVDEEAAVGAALEEEKEEPPRQPTPAPPSASPEPAAEAAAPAPIPQADLDALVAQAVAPEDESAAGEPIPQAEIDALAAQADEPVEDAAEAEVVEEAAVDSPAPQAEVAEEPFAGEVATALEETAEAEIGQEPVVREDVAAPGEPTPPVDAETAAAKEDIPPESPPAEPAAEEPVGAAPPSSNTDVIALQCEVEELRGAVESLREETGRRASGGGTPSPRGAAHRALQVVLGILSAATAGLGIFILVKSADLDWTARLLIAAPWFALSILPLFAMGLLSSLERIREAIERAGGTRG